MTNETMLKALRDIQARCAKSYGDVTGDRFQAIQDIWRTANFAVDAAVAVPTGANETMLDRTRFEINAELLRAREKFPMPNPTFVALAEEVGELAQALLKCRAGSHSHAKAVYDEAIQVAVMAIRVLEEGDSCFPAYSAHLGMAG